MVLSDWLNVAFHGIGVCVAYKGALLFEAILFPSFSSFYSSRISEDGITSSPVNSRGSRKTKTSHLSIRPQPTFFVRSFCGGSGHTPALIIDAEIFRGMISKRYVVEIDK